MKKKKAALFFDVGFQESQRKRILQSVETAEMQYVNGSVWIS